MAWKASKTKLVRSKYIISAIVFGAMVPYMTIFGNIFGNIINSSKNQHNGGGNLLLQCLSVNEINRNKIEPIPLVPWKSTNPRLRPEIEKDDITVPLRASCVSTASLVFFAILAPVYVVLVNQMGEQ